MAGGLRNVGLTAVFYLFLLLGLAVTFTEAATYTDGDRVPNDFNDTECSDETGTQAEAEASCDAQPNCHSLHAVNCDSSNWRYCNETVADLAATGTGTGACTWIKGETTSPTSAPTTNAPTYAPTAATTSTNVSTNTTEAPTSANTTVTPSTATIDFATQNGTSVFRVLFWLAFAVALASATSATTTAKSTSDTIDFATQNGHGALMAFWIYRS